MQRIRIERRTIRDHGDRYPCCRSTPATRTSYVRSVGLLLRPLPSLLRRRDDRLWSLLTARRLTRGVRRAWVRNTSHLSAALIGLATSFALPPGVSRLRLIRKRVDPLNLSDR